MTYMTLNHFDFYTLLCQPLNPLIWLKNWLFNLLFVFVLKVLYVFIINESFASIFFMQMMNKLSRVFLELFWYVNSRLCDDNYCIWSLLFHEWSVPCENLMLSILNNLLEFLCHCKHSVIEFVFWPHMQEWWWWAIFLFIYFQVWKQKKNSFCISFLDYITITL